MAESENVNQATVGFSSEAKFPDGGAMFVRLLKKIFWNRLGMLLLGSYFRTPNTVMRGQEERERGESERDRERILLKNTVFDCLFLNQDIIFTII